MNINVEAQTRIEELESLLEEAYILIDLAETERDEWKERSQVLTGELINLRNDRNHTVAGVLQAF